MKIFLIGFMGAGKTTLGKALAEELQIPFIDLDKRIEKQEGKSIAGLFEALGEAAFRKKESHALQHHDFPEDFIMATGGGTPCFFDNMEWMNRAGITLYLRPPAAEIARRLEHQRNERPLLRNIPREELEAVIAKRIKERESFYLQARQVLEGAQISSQDLLKVIERIR